MKQYILTGRLLDWPDATLILHLTVFYYGQVGSWTITYYWVVNCFPRFQMWAQKHQRATLQSWYPCYNYTYLCYWASVAMGYKIWYLNIYFDRTDVWHDFWNSSFLLLFRRFSSTSHLLPLVDFFPWKKIYLISSKDNGDAWFHIYRQVKQVWKNSSERNIVYLYTKALPGSCLHSIMYLVLAFDGN